MSSHDRRRDDRSRRDDRYSRSDAPSRGNEERDYRRRSRSPSESRRRQGRRNFDDSVKSYKKEDTKDGRWESRQPFSGSHQSPKPEFSVKPEFEEPKLLVEKELPNFEVSGVLAEDQNQRNGVPLLFSLSMDSAAPDSAHGWRLYEFSGDDNIRTEKLEVFSCFLFGTDERLAADHSSDEVAFVHLQDSNCSRQHAVVQFRNRGTVKPYLMDLNSSNKTRLNGAAVEAGRYIELRHQDVIQFGRSANEFVLLDALAS